MDVRLRAVIRKAISDVRMPKTIAQLIVDRIETAVLDAGYGPPCIHPQRRVLALGATECVDCGELFHQGLDTNAC